MNIIALPTELSNLVINDDNIKHLLYKLAYFYSQDCITKPADKNVAVDFVRRFSGIGDENSSIYEKFIPISKANMLSEREQLGFEVTVMDYDYPDFYVTSQLVYKRWLAAIDFEQRIDYKIRSLIDLHDVDQDKIASIIDDCDSLPFTARAEHQLTLMSEIWDPNYYAIYDDNVVWGVGYSEIGAFFSALQNHVWLEKYYEVNEGDEESFIGAEDITPYPDSTALFTTMIEKIMNKVDRWNMPNNMAMRMCTRAVFNKVSNDGLSDFDFSEKGSRLDIA